MQVIDRQRFYEPVHAFLPLMSESGIDSETPAIIDVEASGFGRGSYPIEVGVAFADGATHCGLVLPEPEWTHWDASAESLHGISREVLSAHGLNVRETAQILNEKLAGMTLYSDGWSYDRSWLALLFDAAETIQRFRLETLSSILSEAQMKIWDQTKDAVIRDLNLTRHRASSDALILQKTWLQTRQQAAIDIAS